MVYLLVGAYNSTRVECQNDLTAILKGANFKGLRRIVRIEDDTEIWSGEPSVESETGTPISQTMNSLSLHECFSCALFSNCNEPKRRHFIDATSELTNIFIDMQLKIRSEKEARPHIERIDRGMRAHFCTPCAALKVVAHAPSIQ